MSLGIPTWLWRPAMESPRQLMPEELLWAAVLAQAVIDADGGTAVPTADVQAARAFWRNEDGMLARICAMLNLDMTLIQAAMARREAHRLVKHYAERRGDHHRIAC